VGGSGGGSGGCASVEEVCPGEAATATDHPKATLRQSFSIASGRQAFVGGLVLSVMPRL